MRRVLALTAALTLAGCATTPAPAPVSAGQKAQLAQLQKAYNSGVITRDQFDAQRRKILAPK